MVKWKDKKVAERIVRQPNKPFPSEDELNSKVPKSEWGEDFNGNPQGPWRHCYVIELVDLRDGSKMVFSNSTYSHMLCYWDLKDRVQNMRQMTGKKVFPIIAPTSVPWKTRFGMIQRPIMEDRGWRTFGPEAATIAAPQGKELTTEEVIQDGIPWDDNLSDVVK
jgi:hypothetical protein